MGEKHRIAMVTGGGRGIGKEICLALAKEGYGVVVVARTTTEIEAVAHEIESSGGQALPLKADVSDAEATMATVARVRMEMGDVGVLVNNAGYNELGSFHRMEPDRWWRQINVNLSATYNCCRAVLPTMLTAKSGRIVNISSINGKKGNAFNSAHCTVKHALIGLTRALALEYAESGITVNAVCPGWVKTQLTQSTNIKRAQIMGIDTETLEALIVKNTPQKTAIEPEAVAAAVVFLCSAGAQRMTGQALNVDGGRMNY